MARQDGSRASSCGVGGGCSRPSWRLWQSHVRGGAGPAGRRLRNWGFASPLERRSGCLHRGACCRRWTRGAGRRLRPSGGSGAVGCAARLRAHCARDRCGEHAGLRVLRTPWVQHGSGRPQSRSTHLANPYWAGPSRAPVAHRPAWFTNDNRRLGDDPFRAEVLRRRVGRCRRGARASNARQHRSDRSWRTLTCARPP